ncbi:MAG: hypothetical protein AAF431_07510 [Pseudomonadota bacterium]
MNTANALPVFSELEAHESIRVEVRSIGCFHHSQTVYEFDETSVVISEVISDEQRELGRIKLSPIDIANLDKLMEFYSGERPQGCTTTNSLTIQEISNGKVTSTQTIVDSSCSLDHTKDLTFHVLKRRLNDSLK